MMIKRQLLLQLILAFVLGFSAKSQENRGYKVFQFPANQIPRIDGNFDDWKMVPASYTVGMDQVWDDSRKHEVADSSNLYFSVKVGWVKGLNRLYFLYEAYDDYWDFSSPGLHNDTYELIVDGDMSGGPFIDRFHPNKDMEPMEAFISFHGVHAQNYHIFTPAVGKDWTLVWGAQPWIKHLPYANVASSYNFKPGQSGKYIMEFWITPFDYAGTEGKERAVESQLYEHKKVGLCWAVIDYDNEDSKSNNGFWNLSKEHTMYGNASYCLPFELMPLEKEYRKEIDAQWEHKVIDMSRRIVAFIDKSEGEINSWKWDFGDGNISNEQNPIHKYSKPGKYIVILDVEGTAGKSRHSKVWDVFVK